MSNLKALSWMLGNTSMPTTQPPSGETEADVSSEWIIFSIMVSIAVGTFFMANLKLLRLPYTVLMFLFGMAVGSISLASPTLHSWLPISKIPPSCLFNAFLPILIFEGAYSMEVKAMDTVFYQAVILAGPGLLINTGLVSLLMKWYFQNEWGWPDAILFGSIMSATDPVAVVALLKELGVSKEITTLLDGEAILNDGTAIILFRVMMEIVQGQTRTVVGHILQCIVLLCGGYFWGNLCGFFMLYFLQRSFNHPIVETTITIAGAFICFYVGDVLIGTSGVLSLYYVGYHLNSRKTLLRTDYTDMIHNTWEILVHIANTLIFALVGLIIAQESFPHAKGSSFAFIGLLYVGLNVFRALMIAVLTPILRCFDYQLDLKGGTLMVVGGLRGAVAMALSLMVGQGADKEGGEMILLAGMIIILTISINAIISKPVVRCLKLDAVDHFKKVQMQFGIRRVLKDMMATVDALKSRNYRAIHWAKMNEIEIEDPYVANKLLVKDLEQGAHLLVNPHQGESNQRQTNIDELMNITPKNAQGVMDGEGSYLLSQASRFDSETGQVVKDMKALNTLTLRAMKLSFHSQHLDGILEGRALQRIMALMNKKERDAKVEEGRHRKSSMLRFPGPENSSASASEYATQSSVANAFFLASDLKRMYHMPWYYSCLRVVLPHFIWKTFEHDWYCILYQMLNAYYTAMGTCRAMLPSYLTEYLRDKLNSLHVYIEDQRLEALQLLRDFEREHIDIAYSVNTQRAKQLILIGALKSIEELKDSHLFGKTEAELLRSIMMEQIKKHLLSGFSMVALPKFEEGGKSASPIILPKARIQSCGPNHPATLEPPQSPTHLFSLDTHTFFDFETFISQSSKFGSSILPKDLQVQIFESSIITTYENREEISVYPSPLVKIDQEVGETVKQDGELVGVSVVLEGSIYVYRGGVEGVAKRHSIGYDVGMFHVLNSMPFNLTSTLLISASETCRVMFIPGHVIRSIAEKHPVIGEQWWRAAGSRRTYVTLQPLYPYCHWSSEEIKSFAVQGKLVSFSAEEGVAHWTVPGHSIVLLLCGSDVELMLRGCRGDIIPCNKGQRYKFVPGTRLFIVPEMSQVTPHGPSVNPHQHASILISPESHFAMNDHIIHGENVAGSSQNRRKSAVMCTNVLEGGENIFISNVQASTTYRDSTACHYPCRLSSPCICIEPDVRSICPFSMTEKFLVRIPFLDYYHISLSTVAESFRRALTIGHEMEVLHYVLHFLVRMRGLFMLEEVLFHHYHVAVGKEKEDIKALSCLLEEGSLTNDGEETDPLRTKSNSLPDMRNAAKEQPREEEGTKKSNESVEGSAKEEKDVILNFEEHLELHHQFEVKIIAWLELQYLDAHLSCMAMLKGMLQFIEEHSAMCKRDFCYLFSEDAKRRANNGTSTTKVSPAFTAFTPPLATNLRDALNIQDVLHPLQLEHLLTYYRLGHPRPHDVLYTLPKHYQWWKVSMQSHHNLVADTLPFQPLEIIEEKYGIQDGSFAGEQHEDQHGGVPYLQVAENELRRSQSSAGSSMLPGTAPFLQASVQQGEEPIRSRNISQHGSFASKKSLNRRSMTFK